MASPLQREALAEHLHPQMRGKALAVEAACQAEGLPLRIFESWRSPERQADLYAQGRTRPGRIVTYARGWESYHQYGLAADFVGYVNGAWTWDLPNTTWARLHAIGAMHGLERLGFETPHLQLAGLKMAELMDGDWPEGGDESWAANVSAAINRWTGTPAAPPLPGAAGSEDRPPLAAPTIDWKSTRGVSSSGWHNRFGGVEWRYDSRGVYLRADEATPMRSAGAPITCLAILDLYGQQIFDASRAHDIAPELIVMTIATETAFARRDDFTGPTTFRWEAHVEVTDLPQPDFGDYSAGPMQALASTARDVIRRKGLAYQPFTVAPHIGSQPVPPPATHPLYDGRANIDIGTAEVATRTPKTGDDPILVAAAYNAGGLYQSSQNEWHLRSAGDHLDRSAAWFGDACFVLGSLRNP